MILLISNNNKLLLTCFILMMNKIIPETKLDMGMLQREKEWFLLVNSFLYNQLSLRETV